MNKLQRLIHTKETLAATNQARLEVHRERWGLVVCLLRVTHRQQILRKR